MANRTRGSAAPVLAVLAALALLAGLVAGYARLTLFDSDEFSARAEATLNDDAVKSEIARRVTDDLVLNAQADLVAVRPLIESVVEGLIGAGVFRDLFHNAVRDVHSALFEGNQNTATLTLADVGVVVRGALQALAPGVAKKIPGGADTDVTPIEPPGWLADLAQFGQDLLGLSLVLLALGLALVALALWRSRDRRRTLLTFGIALVGAGVIAAVALGVIRTLLLARIEDTGIRDAAHAIWDVYLGDLRSALYVFAAIGAVLAAAASSLLRPVDVEAPLRRAWETLVRVPERQWLRVLRALGLVVVGALIVINPDAFIHLLGLLAGLYIAYVGVAELIRITIAPPTDEQRAAEMTRGRRTLVAAGIASGVILIGGAIFIASGGTTERAEAIETVGCNGAVELCDRPLDEVAIPTAHNAMSAVTNKDWLLGQQDAGFPDQLHDGIRGLLIDAHYGQPTESGKVKTDLSDLSGGERETYVEALGPEGLDAALRIRDRVVNSETTGPRQVYLCHRFCELGAIPIDTAFRQYRDFLAANSDEVLVIVIEDYVEPADIADAVEESGLIDYVYEGPLDPPPTLQEMIDSGGRVVMMAENDAGGGSIPWYHEAYEELVQETPYTFKKPEALTGAKGLAASCEPNRGPDQAAFFLLNHWIDTTPAPRPSNAEKVNASEALRKRIRRCERIRGLAANLIAVDFYREGDLFDVVEALNAERGSQPPE
jgi:hypothetical protein